MRILITGSSGQIGTNLALRCLAAKHEVIGVDLRPNEWTADVETITHDLSESFPDICADIVVHLAAHPKVHELVRNPSRAFANVAMTHHVLEHCRHRGLPVIFSSSREVYGNIDHVNTRECDADFALSESPYAASKIACESLIYSYARCYDLRYLVFRLSNVYGRYDTDLQRVSRVVPLFIEQISNHQPVTIFGAQKLIDFTYIDDCVSGLFAGIERLAHGRVRNETINLASGTGHSLPGMAQYIGDVLGISPQLRFERARSGEVIRYVANIEKAQALLDFSPMTKLQVGIQHAIDCAATMPHKWHCGSIIV